MVARMQPAILGEEKVVQRVHALDVGCAGNVTSSILVVEAAIDDVIPPDLVGVLASDQVIKLFPDQPTLLMITSHPPLTYSARRNPDQPVLLDLVTGQDLSVHLVVTETGHTSASKRTGLFPFTAWAPSNPVTRDRHALSTGLEPWRAIHTRNESRSCPSRIFRMRSGGDRRRGFVFALIL
jgi:hypothetical protein